MSVVDEDGNTTFQVLANGDVTAHDVTATTVTGGTVIGETIRNTNNSFSVDANGNVDAETVKSEGMSVVDEDGNTTFQVLSNGDVTAHAVTATTVTGGTIQNADGSFSVDANGNVDAETVKSEGMSVVDEDGNTTFQVLANGDVTAHDVTATTVTGGTVIGETIRNTNNSFSVDANGNVDAETVKSEGMSVVDEDGNTTFQVLSNGDVTAHAVTATTVTGGTIQNADGSFSVDANGNVDAETVKSEGMSVVDEDGNTTFQVLSNGDVTAHDVIANSYSNVNGTFVADENGKVTAEKGDIGDVKLADGKVTAKKGAIGDVWLSEGNISNVKKITAKSGNIGDVKLADGKVTAKKGAIGDVWLSEGNISNVQNIKAESGNIGDVKLADGKVMAQKADIGGVFIKNESIQAGNIKINENSSNEITGLSNTTWNPEDPDSIVENRAATEGQLMYVDAQVKVNSDDLAAYKAAGIVAGNEVGPYSNSIALGNNATVDGTNSIAVGAGSTADRAQATALGQNSNALGQGTVSLGANTKADGEGAVSIGFNNSAEAAGSVAIGNGARVYESGTNSVALGQWSTTSDEKVVSVGNDWLKRRITNVADGIDPTDAVNVQQLTDRTAHMVEWDEGTKDTIHGVTLNGGTISAADDKFNVWSSGGMEAIYGKFDGNIEAAGGNFKVNGTTGGITTAGGIEAASGITAANDNFNVWNSGGMEAAYGKFKGNIEAAGGNFKVNGATGDITTAGQITAANDKFHVWNSGGIAIGEGTSNPLFSVNGYNGDVKTQGEIVAKGMYVGSKDADNAVVTQDQLAVVDSKAQGNTDVLAGYKAAGITAGSIDETVADNSSIAIGNEAKISQISGLHEPINSIAIGHNAGAHNQNTISIGADSNVSGENSVAIGKGAQATAYNSVALGWGSVADTNPDKLGIVSVGNKDMKRRITNVAAGKDDTDAVNVSQLNAVKNVTDGLSKAGVVAGSVGDVTTSLALGNQSSATKNNSVALGPNATAKVADAVALGANSLANRVGSVSVGSNQSGGIKRQIVNVADGTYAHDAATVGQIADVLGLKDPNGKGLQIGRTFINGAKSVVEGINTNSKAIEKLHSGQNNIWSSLDTSNQNLETMMSKASTFAAMTSNVDWKALNSMDWNSLNAVSQISTMSLDVTPTMLNEAPTETTSADTAQKRDPVWDNIKVTEDTTTVKNNLTVEGDTQLNGKLDVKGEATFNNDVNIKGDLNMNNNKITGVADGTDAHDAVNFGQLDKVQQQVDANTQNISTLGGAVNKLGNRIDEVGAGAAALAALHPLDFDPDNKWDFSAGYGNYRGESAVAFGAFYRPNEDTMFSVGGTVGNDDNMVNAGVSLKIGSGSSGVTTSRVAMAKEIKAMRDVVAKQDAQIQKLTAMVNALVGVEAEPDTTTMFPDVPENHWAYEAVAAMARSGLVKGYPDGEFKGDRTMTRYEFAQIIQNAIQAGAEVDSRLVEEFKPELEYFHIATVAKDKDGNPTIERVRAN